MSNRSKFIILFLLIPVLFVWGCAAQNIKSYAEMTPEEKLVYMYQIYNAQHEDYMNMAANPFISEEQKEVLRTKKTILESLQILIPAYDQSVQLGSPTLAQEQQIYNLLNQLQGMVVM